MRSAAAVLVLAVALAGCGKVDPLQEAADAASDAVAALPPEAYDPTKLSVSMKRCPVKTCPSSSANYVTVQVTVKQKDGSPPLGGFGVFVAFNRPGEKPNEQPAACSEIAANDPGATRGVYRCLGIVEGPGKWRFSAALFRPGPAAGQSPVTTVATTFDIADAVPLKGEPAVS